MPPAKKVTLCNAFIKTEDLKIKVCGKTLRPDGLGGTRCPDREEHILKYKTGYCANGDCEGTAKKTPAGKARPTCKWWKRCPCECHKMYDTMFAAAEMERQVVDNSGYVPDHGGFKMPTLEERIALHASFNAEHSTTPAVIESPAPEVVPPVIRRAFAPTPSGRAARGELTSWVRRVCDEFLIDEDLPYKCTPAYISEHVAKNEGFAKPPSVGAVDAVLKRWELIGFAKIERKPTRFVGYTEDGIRLGLEGCIERAKRQRKSQVAEASRSFRR